MEQMVSGEQQMVEQIGRNQTPQMEIGIGRPPQCLQTPQNRLYVQM